MLYVLVHLIPAICTKCYTEIPQMMILVASALFYIYTNTALRYIQQIHEG